ncbi:lipoyl(octanoyl) transferase LipB [Saccharopolyspora taberi]|uniref:Octanoyltransferase n=1 Tax=Saccharopolyspora taberi TaxID=60895 RepID=A0ABN3V3Q7_9PSEU
MQQNTDSAERRDIAGPEAAAPVLSRVDLGEIPYDYAVKAMQEWVQQRRDGTAGDRLFLLSHPPVITYGRHTDPGDLPAVTSSTPTVEVDRGGFATYHGPGQLVGYLVLNTRARGPVDIVRWLENGLITALDSLGFRALRRDTPSGATSLVGVWTPDERKIASIGMRIRGGITSHGFALNIDPDMTAFQQFTACALQDVSMTSLRELADEQGIPTPGEAEVRDAVSAALGAV